MRKRKSSFFFLLSTFNSCSGFTLIELTIVVAITVAIGAAVFVNAWDFFASRNVDLTLDEIAAAIRETQRRAVTQDTGTAWGIRFTNGTSTTDRYEVASGTAYSASSVSKTYTFRRAVEFSEPVAGTSTDIFFNAISGKTSGSKIISVVGTGRGSLVGDVIVDPLGRVNVRLEKGLVGYWHFNEGTASTTYDASGSSNSGTSYGPAWQTESSCKAGRCLSFDGTDDYVSVANSSSLNPTGAISVAGWIKPNNIIGQTMPPIVKKIDVSGGYTLEISNSNSKLSFSVYISGVGWATSTSPSALSTGTWYHAVGTYDGSNIRLYLNGVQATSTAQSGNLAAAASALNIGRDPSAASGLWNGWIDEVKVYNRAISASEISDLYSDLR